MNILFIYFYLNSVDVIAFAKILPQHFCLSICFVLVEFDKSETNLMMRRAGLFDSPSISINQYRLAPISINWRQSVSISTNQHQLASISINWHQSVSIGIDQWQCANVIVNQEWRKYMYIGKNAQKIYIGIKAQNLTNLRTSTSTDWFQNSFGNCEKTTFNEHIQCRPVVHNFALSCFWYQIMPIQNLDPWDLLIRTKHQFYDKLPIY